MVKLGICVLLLALALSTANGCTNPKVKSTTYSTENQYFSGESVFIAQVEVDCNGESISLHALVGGQLLPVSKGITSGSTEHFQVSWTEDHDRSGSREVKFYDDNGASSIRKALRYGEEVTTSPLFSVDIKHKNSSNEMWLSPAFLAMIAGLLVYWLAYMAKCKLQE
ncbi:Translocon-associated protein subunit delta [Geodia barretti]|uniref:Translocon-associated protein subunit delta n=1 Tax=Geodia barretti TaxID=519541 RepID=A0AA35TIB7_GEOBA|nr:Translocon-associated protein subunit delta [Geodia barretti]